MKPPVRTGFTHRATIAGQARLQDRSEPAGSFRRLHGLRKSSMVKKTSPHPNPKTQSARRNFEAARGRHR